MADQLTQRDKIEIIRVLFNEDAGTGQRVIDLLGLGGSAVQSVSGNNVDNTDPQNPVIISPTPPLPDGLLSGGRVTWIQNYDYEVSAATYVINGVFYSSPTTLLTLSASDLTDDRIDVFVVTIDGTAEVVEGTAATPALEPDVDPASQIKVGFALVSAGSTAPTLVTENIYLENTEWATSASAGTINPDSLNNPYAGIKDVEGTAVANGQFIDFTPTSFPSLLSLGDFIFRIRSKAAWNAPSRLTWRFYNGNVAIGNAVTIGGNANPFGFVSGNVGVYQSINVPLSTFGNIAAATKLRLTKTGAGTIGFYVDNIMMQQTNNTNANLPTSRVYRANLQQTGTNAPVATVLNSNDPDFLGTIVWSYSSTGHYVGTLAGAFPSASKLWFNLSAYPSGAAVAGRIPVLTWNDTNSFILDTTTIQAVLANTSVPLDGVLGLTSGYTCIEIRVYQ